MAARALLRSLVITLLGQRSRCQRGGSGFGPEGISGSGGDVKEFAFTELGQSGYSLDCFCKTDTSKISFEESSPLATRYPGCVDRGHETHHVGWGDPTLYQLLSR